MEFPESFTDSLESKRLIKSPDQFVLEKLFKIVNRQLEEMRSKAEDRKDSLTVSQYNGYLFEWKMWEFFNDLKPNYICDPDFEEPFRFDLSKFKKASNDAHEDGWNLVSKQGSKQMDVVAIFDKHIFIVECKHTKKETSTSKTKFGTIIEDFAIRKKFIQKRISDLFGTELVPVFIICTENYVLDDEEQLKSLKEEDIIILTEPEREYITTVLKGEKDKKTLKYKGGSGSAEFAFSQFLGYFRGDKPDFNDPPRKETKWRIPAFHSLSGESKKHKVYTFSISPSKMLKISTVAHQKLKHSFEVSKASQSYYQRVLSKKRLTSVGQHLMESKIPFPNNILVSYRGKNIGWEPDTIVDKEINQGNIPGILEFDACPGSFHVIDGQHRLFGYTATPKDQGIREEHRLIVTAFDGLSVEDEADIFLDVNSNAKPITPDLLMEIEWASQAKTHINICNGVVFNLRDNENSCLYDFILQAESRQRGRMSAKNMQTAMTSLKIINKNFEESMFWDTDISTTANKIYEFLNNALLAFRNENEDRWKKSNGVTQDIFMSGILKVIDRIAILEKGNLKKTEEYMRHFGKSFSKESNKRKDQVLKIKSFFTLGAAAPSFVAAWIVDTYLKEKNPNLVEETDSNYLIFIDKEDTAKELIKAHKKITSLQRQIIKFEERGLSKRQKSKPINTRATEYCGILKNIVHEILARDDHYTLQLWEWLVMPAFWSKDNVWDKIHERHNIEKNQSGGNSYVYAFNHVEGRPLRQLVQDFKKYKKAKPITSENGLTAEDRMNNTLSYFWEKLLIPPPDKKFSKKINLDPNFWEMGTEYMSIFEKCRNYGSKIPGSPHVKLLRETGDPAAEEKKLFESYYEEEFFNVLRKIRGDIETLQDMIDDVLE